MFCSSLEEDLSDKLGVTGKHNNEFKRTMSFINNRFKRVSAYKLAITFRSLKKQEVSFVFVF